MKTSGLKSLEHGLKRAFFALTQSFLRRGISRSETIDPHRIKRVLFLRPDKLGDMIVSLPVFYNLKKLHPHLELYLISSPRNAAVVRNNAYIQQNFLYTKNIWRDIGTLREIRRLDVDAVVDMVSGDSVTTLFLSQWCSNRARRIGRDKTRQAHLYDRNFEAGPDDSGHAVDSALHLLVAFGIDARQAAAEVPPTIDTKYNRAAAEFEALILRDNPGGIIGLNISAGRPSRVWPDEKNKTLIDRLTAIYPSCRIVISSVPCERSRAEALAGEFRSRVSLLPAGDSLLEVAAMIGRMKILITPDTSLVHLARSFRIPVVGLYTRYEKNLRMWRPYNQEGGIVISGNDYNIFDIEVEPVLQAVTTLLPPGDKS